MPGVLTDVCRTTPLLISVLLFSGCGPEDTPSSDVDAAPAARSAGSQPANDPVVSVTPGTDTGTLIGTVSFAGVIPPPRIVQATKDEEVCSRGAGEVQDVEVKEDRLANVIIELAVDSDSAASSSTTETEFVIRQKDCRFSPRLMVLHDGAEVVIHNDDPVPHNVNSGAWNLMQTPGSDPLRQEIRYNGTSLNRLTCNIHGWMESWLYVTRSPCYAVSAADGMFRVEGIPPGTKIRGTATHVSLGKQRFRIDIEPGETITQNFTFEGP